MGYDELDDEYRPAYEQAVGLSESAELFRAFTELSRDPDRFAKAAEAGNDMLREYGVDVPEPLTVLISGGHDMPMPEEWYPFRIVLSNCRKFYKIDRTKRPPQITETEPICFTFSIVPTPIPGGPRG